MSKDCILTFFGCFSPPTNGHLAAITMAYDHLASLGYNMIKAIIVPAHGGYGKPGLIPADMRVDMCRLMAATTDFIEIDDSEAKKDTWSRTINTLEQIQSANPNAKIFMLFGSDVIKSFETGWRQPDVIRFCEEFGIVVLPRNNEDLTDITRLCSWLDGRTQNIIVMESNPMELISSTLVRKRLEAKKHVSGFLVPEVEKYIKEKKLYGT